jgi:hypothetical protein
MKKEIYLSKIKRITAIMGAVLIALIVAVSGVKSTAYAATAEPDWNSLEGVDMEQGLNITASETTTRTFLSLKLGGMNLGMPSDMWGGRGSSYHNEMEYTGVISNVNGVRPEYDVTLIIAFYKITIPKGKQRGKNVIVTCNAKLKFPSPHFNDSDAIEVVLEPDDIYVFDSWYDLFNYGDNDKTEISVSVWGKGHAVPLPVCNYTKVNGKPGVKVDPDKKTPSGKEDYNYVHKNTTVSIDRKEVPIGIDDIYSEDYNGGNGVGGNTGSVKTGEEKEQGGTFFGWLAGILNADETTVMYVFMGILGIVILVVAIKLWRFVFGGKKET